LWQSEHSKWLIKGIGIGYQISTIFASPLSLRWICTNHKNERNVIFKAPNRSILATTGHNMMKPFTCRRPNDGKRVALALHPSISTIHHKNLRNTNCIARY